MLNLKKLFAANGAYKASQNYSRVPETISTNGYNCKLFFKVSINFETLFVFPHLMAESVIHVQTEMMSDAIDDVLDNDEAEDETEDLTNQVLRTLRTAIIFFKCVEISAELKPD